MKRIVSVLILLICPILVGASDSQRDFGFGAMEIFEFSNLTSDLLVRDMNRDGRDDILFLNNRVSRLEILIRKEAGTEGQELPTLEERFTNQGFVLDNWAQDFRAADLNGDNLPDIVTIDDQKGIQVHIQETEGVFAEPVSISIKDPAKLKDFEIGDLNSDGRIDILVYRQENAEIFYNSGQGEFKTQGTVTVDFSAYGCQGIMVADINSDKIPDLLFYFPREGLPLRVRLGKGEGQFSWEEALNLPNTRVIEKLDLTGNSTCQLAMIMKNGLILRLYEFESRPGKPLFRSGLREVSPRRLPLKGISRKSPPTWVTADIDSDGYSDFCAAAPLLNQVHLYKGSVAGLSFSPIAIDSLRGIKTMALTGRGDLVVFSEAEKAIAVHNNKNLTAFPQFLKAPGAGEPVAMDAAGDSTVFVLFKNKELSFTLDLFNSRVPGDGSFESHKTGLRNAPLAMKVFPLAGMEHWGIILFMPYDKPVMYRLQKGSLSSVTPEQFRALGSSLEPQAVTIVGSKDRQVLMVAEENVARLYRWDRDRFVVAGQLNPGVESARLIAGCPCSAGEKGYLLYDDANQEVYRFSNGSTQTVSHMHIQDGVKDLIGLAALQLKEDRGILMVGQSEIQWLQEGAVSLHLKNLGEYVSKMEKPSLWNLFPVSLGSPGRPMAAMLDANNRSVELVSFKEGKLVEELVFEVFQDPGFNTQMAETIYEPHDLAAGDFNGDQMGDMAVLVHDKLIIYLGE